MKETVEAPVQTEEWSAEREELSRGPSKTKMTIRSRKTASLDAQHIQTSCAWLVLHATSGRLTLRA
jgi:hypothetical protein